MAERNDPSRANEKSESETHRRKRGTALTDKDSIESRKQEIADGLSQTRERGERVFKEMHEAVLKKAHRTK